MSQLPGNNKIVEAVVEITADTQPLEHGVQKANAELGKLGTTGATAGIDIAANLAPAAAAAVAVGAAAFEAGKQLGEMAEKTINKGTDDDYLFTREEKLASLRKKAKEYREEATKTTLAGTLDDLLSNGTTEGRFKSDRAVAVKNYNDTLNEIADLEAKDGPRSPKALRKKEASLQKEIEQAELATLDGAERIERKRQQAIERVRKQYGGDNGEAKKLEDLINQGADKDLQKWNENQDKKQARELADIEVRRTAYDDLIRQQQAKELENARKIATEITNAISSATANFNKTFSIERIQSSLDKIASTIEVLARQR